MNDFDLANEYAAVIADRDRLAAEVAALKEREKALEAGLREALPHLEHRSTMADGLFHSLCALLAKPEGA